MVLSELSKDILKKGKSVRFQAKGWSMHPFIQDRDFITVSPVEKSSIKIGDVVFYSTTEDRVVVHRFIGKYHKDNSVFMLIKGDTTFWHFERVDLQNILGKVEAIERNGQTKKINTGFYRLKGMFFAGISPLISWLYAIGSRVKRSIGYISNS